MLVASHCHNFPSQLDRPSRDSYLLLLPASILRATALLQSVSLNELEKPSEKKRYLFLFYLALRFFFALLNIGTISVIYAFFLKRFTLAQANNATS